MAHLEIFTGCHTGQYIELEDDLRLGRDPENDFALSDPLSSRYHARITRHGEKFVIEDLQSLNGTTVRGMRIPSATPYRLNAGDEIEIGTTRMIFFLHDGFAAQEEVEWGKDRIVGGRSVFGGQIPLGHAKTLSLRLLEEDIPNPLIVATVDAAMGMPATSETGGDTELQQAYRRLRAMHQISTALGTITDLNVLMLKLLDCLFDIYLEAERSFVLLSTPENDTFFPAAAKVRHEAPGHQEELAISRTIVNEVLTQKHAILSRDALIDNRFKEQESVITHRIRSMMCAPLLVEDEIIGVIQLDTNGQPKSFTADDLQVLTGICSQAAIAVKNARLLARLETANAALQREIAERQRAEAASRRAWEQAAHAQAASTAKNEILTNISHELRTPMNGVIGMMTLLSDTPLSAEQCEYVDTIRHCSLDLMALIDDILDFSEMEAGKLRLEPTDFNLCSVVQEIIDLFAAKAKHKGLELTCRFHADVPAWVTADAARLRKALQNLVGNAVKFTHSGAIAVEVTQDSRSGKPGAWICFAVTDTGIGISPEVREQIFQAFRQADSSLTRQYGGTGLGLAIVRHLATLMGGTIGVDSVPGQGSTFWLSVPLTPCPELPPEEGSDGSPQEA